MDITITPGKLSGEVTAIPSKSQAHRLLICAAFANNPTELICPDTNRDIEATVDCLNALGAHIRRTDVGYIIQPIAKVPAEATLNCCESGSTLRFMLPIVGALGVDAIFQMAGRLPHRPLSPLWEEMERMGCKLRFISENELVCDGQLRPGDYYMDGGVSSQFITGLLFATSLLVGDSTIHITGNLESRPYVDMTQRAMKQFGVDTDGYMIKGGQTYRSPGKLIVEGDWSNGAFWLAAKALGNDIEVSNLDPNSPQGDRTVVNILKQLDTGTPSVSAKDIPDLVPILSVAAAAKHGAVFTDIRRLRLKESDRVASTIAMLKALCGRAEATEDALTIYPSAFTGGTVDAVNDHRIAMAAAIAATCCSETVTITGTECVEKSYPKFWEEYARLGGNYELDLR